MAPRRGPAEGSPNDAEGSRWGQLPWGSPTPPGVLSSPRCPQLLQVSPTPSGPHSPWVLQLWSWRRAGEACRGQQVPARRARGGQSRAVSSMPRVVPGGEVAGPGRPQGWGHCWGGSPHHGRLLGHRCGQHPRAGPQGTAKGPGRCAPGVSGTEGGGCGGAMPGGTGRAVVPSGYLQEENASKNHLLTLKLTSLLGIEAPKGKTVLGGEGRNKTPAASARRHSSSPVL